MKNKDILNTVLLNLEDNEWTTRDACTGVLCFGMTGSGKSSGPLQNIAHKYLENNYGGVVFCAKPDEYETWREYAKKTNRTKDIIRLTEETFNFLDYEISRPKLEGGGQIENVVNLFLEVVNISDQGKVKNNSDDYFKKAIRQFLCNCIVLLTMSKKVVTVQNIKTCLDSVCRSADDAKCFIKYIENFIPFCEMTHISDLRKSQKLEDFIVAKNEFDEICKNKVELDWFSVGYNESERYCASLLLQALFYTSEITLQAFSEAQSAVEDENKRKEALLQNDKDVESRTELNDYNANLKKIEVNDLGVNDYLLASNFFIGEFPQLDERTRSNTISSFTVLADRMLRGEFRRCFCDSTTSLNIEDIYKEGKILIVDQDVKRHGDVGKITAAIIKLCFEKMIERRDDISSTDARPVFLWADECQYFALDYDQMFQTTARSSRVLTVYATQNIGNLNIGYGKEKAGSLMGNLGTKIFCQNGDVATNQLAADSIGKDIILRKNRNFGDSKSLSTKTGANKSNSFSEGASEQKDYIVEINTFTHLQTGGPRGKCKVGYVLWQSGRIFNNDKSFIHSTFDQECKLYCGARKIRKCPSLDKKKSLYQKTTSVFRIKDLLILLTTLSLFSISGFGFYLIYSGKDILVFQHNHIIITVATFLLTGLLFAFERLLHLSLIIVEIIKFKISKEKRPVYKHVNGLPLYIVFYLSLFISFILAIFLQRNIYNGEKILPFFAYWFLLSIMYKTFKSSGAKKIKL